MVKFRAFQDESGQVVYVNPDLVRVVWSMPERKALIEFDSEHSVGISKDADLVVQELETQTHGLR